MNRIEIDSPGHFIGAPRCKFFKHTHIGNRCISTVGEYHSAEGRLEEIGYGRLYETMVFPIDSEGRNLSWGELEADAYNSRRDAEAGHEDMCFRYSEEALDAQ